MIKLDGGILEGGGQILRLSMCLGALLDKPLSIENIRAGRKKPGLSSQHMTGLKLVNNLCSGLLDGCTLQSTKIEFRPKGGVNVVEAEVSADIGTAGSVCLLAQIALPCILFNSHAVKLRLLGGTNAGKRIKCVNTKWLLLFYKENDQILYLENEYGLSLPKSIPS